MAAARARALARLAVLDDHHVAELGPAAVEPAAGDDAAADAGAEREQHELARVPRPAPATGSASAAALASLSTADRQAEPLAHLGAEARGRGAGCSRRRGRRRCAGRRAPGRRIPTAATSGVPQLAHHLDERRRAGLPATSSGVGRSSARSTRAVLVDEPGEDLRPAEIDPDDARCRPRRRVPYFSGWRRTRSPTASTEAVASRARSRPSRADEAAPGSRARSPHGAARATANGGGPAGAPAQAAAAAPSRGGASS